jgi:hypothetical protein
MTVVKFVSDQPRQYSINNNNPLEFTPGEYYDVPPHVARGMFKRGWAEPASAEELAAAVPADNGDHPHKVPGDADDQERIAADRAAKEAEEAEAAVAEQERQPKADEKAEPRRRSRRSGRSEPRPKLPRSRRRSSERRTPCASPASRNAARERRLQARLVRADLLVPPGGATVQAQAPQTAPAAGQSQPSQA